MSRRRIHVTAEEIIKVRTGRTLSETARELGMGRATLCNRIKEYGIGEGRGRYDRTFSRRRKRSVVHKGLVEHSGEKLPGNVGGLAEILGIPPENVRSYLERGRRSTERFCKEVLTKAPSWVILKDHLNVTYPLGSFNRISVVMDRWGRNVRFFVDLKNGETTMFRYNVTKLWNNMEEQIANKK